MPGLQNKTIKDTSTFIALLEKNVNSLLKVFNPQSNGDGVVNGNLFVNGNLDMQGNSIINTGTMGLKTVTTAERLGLSNTAGTLVYDSDEAVTYVNNGTAWQRNISTLSSPDATSLAIGLNAGDSNQGTDAIALGSSAGVNDQSNLAVAIGSFAGHTSQGLASIAVGSGAGQLNGQGAASVALGLNAGNDNLGASSIAIGQNAGSVNQADNSIVLNATGVAVQNTNASSTVITPLRDVATAAPSATNILHYDAAGELMIDDPIVEPASAGSTGTPGMIRFVSGFLYVCVATDTWERVAIATW